MKPILSLIALLCVSLVAFQGIGGKGGVGGKAGFGGGSSLVYFTPSFVQAIPQVGAGVNIAIGASSPNTFGTSAPLTAGDAMVCGSYANGSASAIAIGDTVNTYTNVVNNAAVTAGGVWSAWVVKSEIAGTVLITITVTGTFTQVYTSCVEFAHPAANPFDQGPATATALTSTAVTPSICTEFMFGALVGGNGGTTPTAAGSWTLLGASSAGPTNPGFEYQVVTGSCSAISSQFAAGTGTVQASILTFEAHTNP